MLRMRHCEALFIESEAFSHTGSFEWNIATHCFESCSRAFADILDLTVEAVLDPQSGFSAVLERVHPGDRQEYQALFDNLGETGLSDIEFRIRRVNGAKRDLYQVGIASPGIDRDSSIVSGILCDRSAHAGSELGIRYGKSLALQSEQISQIGSYLYDESEDYYLYASPGCARIYGMSEPAFFLNFLAGLGLCRQAIPHSNCQGQINTLVDCRKRTNDSVSKKTGAKIF